MSHSIPTIHWQEPAAEGKRQSFRFRKILDADGTEVRALTTRYSFAEGTFIRNDGPRGGKRIHTFPRNAYYLDGRFCRIRRAPLDAEGREWSAFLEPISGTITDVYPIQSSQEGIPDVSIVCRDGYPICTAGALPWSADSGIPFVEGIAPWLKLDRKPRKRTEKAA